jgi:hypothetical protein
MVLDARTDCKSDDNHDVDNYDHDHGAHGRRRR